jgi:hypothetical protein
MSERFAAPPSLVDALVSEDRELAAAAYGALRRRVLRCRHPAVIAGTAAQRDELVQDIAMMLTREPATAASASVHTWAGLDTAIRRWIDQCRGDSIEDRATAYREHLWHKLGALLSDASRFVKPPRSTGYVRAGEPVTEGLEVQTLFARLQGRAPILRSRREDQLAELITLDALGALVEEVFWLGGNAPRTRATLVEAALHALGLASGPVVGSLDEQALDPAHDATAWSSEGEERARAARFVASLPARTRRAAALRFTVDGPPRPLEQVAQALGTSRGTAENEVGDRRGRFGAMLRAFADEEELDEPARVALLAAIFDRLAIEPTEPLEEAQR